MDAHYAKQCSALARVTIPALWKLVKLHLNNGAENEVQPLFYSIPKHPFPSVAQVRMRLGRLEQLVLFDTGAGRSCISVAKAQRLKQLQQATHQGFVRVALNTGAGTIGDSFELLRMTPSKRDTSLTEEFLVVPTLPPDIIILGMSFLRNNCVLDLPEGKVVLAGPWRREVSEPILGTVRSKLLLVAAANCVVPPCDPDEEPVTTVLVTSLGFVGSAGGTVRQTEDLMKTHNLFTISEVAENFQISQGQASLDR